MGCRCQKILEIRTMRLLILTTDYRPRIGGIATYSYHIAEGFSHLCKVTVLTVKTRGWKNFDAKQNFDTIRVVNWPVVRELMFTSHIIRLIRNNQIDRILNSMWFPCGAISLFIWRVFRMPYFISAHGSEFLDDKTSFKRRLKKALSRVKLSTMRNAKRIFPVSHYTRNRLLEIGISSLQIRVVPNGVDIDKFVPKNVNISKARWGLESKKVLLTVARLDLHKGHNVVIRSLPQLVKKIPNLVYIIAGKGPEERRLKYAVRELRLDQRVFFLGYVPEEDLPDLYNACDLFIMPSREISGREDLIEGFGISFLEANACGKPTIGGRSGGVIDAIVDGQTGMLVNPTDVQEVSKATYKLLIDEEYASRLGRQGRQRMEDELNWDKICNRLNFLMKDM